MSPLLAIAPHWQQRLTACGWNTLDDLFGLPNDRTLSKAGLPGWRERLRAALPGPDGDVVYVKRYRRIPLGEQFRRWRRGDRNHGTAWAEWRWLCELSRLGIPVPEPVAYGEQMRGSHERRSALVVASAAGVSLERWSRDNRRPLPHPVLRRLAEVTGQLHAAGVAHRDLYLAHVFVEALESDAPQLTLIDLQRAVSMRGRTRWIIKDLAALNFSTPAWAASPWQRLRWFIRYRRCAGWEHRDRGRSRLLLRRIVAKTVRMQRRDVRRKAALR